MLVISNVLKRGKEPMVRSCIVWQFTLKFVASPTMSSERARAIAVRARRAECMTAGGEPSKFDVPFVRAVLVCVEPRLPRRGHLVSPRPPQNRAHPGANSGPDPGALP